MITSSTPPDLSDASVWRELDAKLRPYVARRVRSEADADDIVQDVFLRIQRGLPTLRDDQRFGPWVYQIARNAIVDYLRASARRASAPDPFVEAIETSSMDPDERAVEREVATYAALFVAMLPSPYREALTLIELEGLTQKEAADMLGISLSGMKSRVQRGRQKLRAALEACCEIALDARRRVLSCERRPGGSTPKGCNC